MNRHGLPLAFWVAVLLLPQTLFASVLHVPAGYATIAEAVGAALSGDTVQVAAGIYYETVYILDKSVTLEGAGSEVTTIAWGTSVAIENSMSGVSVIRGFTLRTTGSCGTAVSIKNARAVIESCCITGLVCPWGPPFANAAVSVRAGSDVTLRANHIHSNSTLRAAIDVRDARVDIRHNLIRSNAGEPAGGIYLLRSVARIEHNTLIENVATGWIWSGGIGTRDCDSIEISNNVIAFNSGWGVLLEDSTEFSIEYNDVFDNSFGAYLAVGWTADPGDSPSNLTVDPGLAPPDFLPSLESPLLGAASDGGNIGLDSAVCGCAPPPPAPVCGNGVREPGEQCDDGNTDCFDGCNKYCYIEPGACSIKLTGDVNQDCVVSSADIIALVNFVFKGGLPPVPCNAAGDVNCSGSVTSADIIGLVGYAFKGAAGPCDACTSPLATSCP